MHILRNSQSNIAFTNETSEWKQVRGDYDHVSFYTCVKFSKNKRFGK